MIEITNRGQGPIQLMVRSKNKVSGFTTQILPGRGKNKNVCLIEDEQMTDQINFLEQKKFVVTRTITPMSTKQ